MKVKYRAKMYRINHQLKQKVLTADFLLCGLLTWEECTQNQSHRQNLEALTSKEKAPNGEGRFGIMFNAMHIPMMLLLRQQSQW